VEDKQEGRITPELAAARWSLAYRENEEFRAEFDKDPKAAISKLIGQDIPSDVEVVVHYSKAGQVHVVVPDEIPDMTEEQLDSISGGLPGWMYGGYYSGHDSMGGSISGSSAAAPATPEVDSRRAEWDRIREANSRIRVQKPI